MSAAELLKQVKSLSPSERKKFVKSVLAMNGVKRASKKKTAPSKKVKWPDVLEQASRVTGGRTIPNIILLEREESEH